LQSRPLKRQSKPSKCMEALSTAVHCELTVVIMALSPRSDIDSQNPARRSGIALPSSDAPVRRLRRFPRPSGNAFDRLAGLISNGTVAAGGETDADELYIAPTVLVDGRLTRR